jgi:hypothetical protein
MGEYWTAAEKDAKADDLTRALGRGMNAARKIVYSRHQRTLDWRNTS